MDNKKSKQMNDHAMGLDGSAVIRVVGVGGGGSNAVDRMIEETRMGCDL